jgi:hypothetical protein
MPRLLASERSRRTAYRLLLAVGLPGVFLLALWIASAKTESTSKPTFTDRDLYAITVQDMRAGRSYYEAHGAEMRAHGYPTRSVFNWRQPLLLEAVAYLAPFASWMLLVVLGGALLVQAHGLLRRELFGLVTVANAAAVVLVPGEVYFTEVWAGLCLGLSAVAYARGREKSGAGWAVVALFVRELAAPYCVVATVLALRRRRWRELGVWSAGAVLYSIYYAMHMWQVFHHRLPGDGAHSHSWLYVGGLPFLLKIWQQSPFLIAAPPLQFAAVPVAALAAWWAPKMPIHVRASVLVYSVLFFFVGLPFNTYWGDLISPLIGLWLVYVPAGLSTLWTRAELAVPPLTLNLFFRRNHGLGRAS